MTQEELNEIEARLDAELVSGGWDDPEDVTYNLMRDEMPRLIAEVRKLQSLLAAYRGGVAGMDAAALGAFLQRALQAGRRWHPGMAPPPAESLQLASLEALERELRQELRP